MTEATYNRSLCICPVFGDTGGYRIADLCCPVHGINAPKQGDDYWETEEMGEVAYLPDVPGFIGSATVNLFQRGDFTLHSGSKSGFKVDCDALSDEDIETLAWIIFRYEWADFGSVEGVPTGGLRLAQALQQYARPDITDTLLICDDVCTSGASLEEHRAGRDARGIVIFNRGGLPSWATGVWNLGWS